MDPSNKDTVKSFLADLDAEDGYCIAQKATNDPTQYLLKSDRLWTGVLLDDDELERAISQYAKVFPQQEDFIRYVVGRNFRPADGNSIPITTIPGTVTVEAISRIFSTLNSTGKMLTPFELVVSILYPKNVNLASDVEMLRELFPYYARIDKTGDLLLTAIALFAGKDTRKASLPKTITVDTYNDHRDAAVEFLDASAKLISERLGLGLDESDELLVYPVIFPPAAYAMRDLRDLGLDHQQKSAAYRRMEKWFVGSVLSRRYQQSTHDKQAKDKVDMVRWLSGSESDMPEWLRETYIINLRAADPSGAMGKLLQCLMNARGIADPLTNCPVGVGSAKRTSSKHHIFPSRFVTSLPGWDKTTDRADLALNIMFCEQSTNASFLHLDPAMQISMAIGALGSEAKARDVYLMHGITSKAFDILAKPNKSRDDYWNFIAEREAFFVGLLEQYGFTRPTGPVTEEALEDEAA